MSRRLVSLLMVTAAVVLVPFRAPAPLVYTPGEGWTYEPVGGGGSWQRPRAKDQLAVAQAAFDQKDYRLALKAARRVVKTWPLSDYAPAAQYLVGRAYEAKKNDERAFKEYQTLITKFPKSEQLEDVLQRQYNITMRFLGGKRFRLWGYIPLFPSMEKTEKMFTEIVANAPYSDVAPQSQINIGVAHEKQKQYEEAVTAYERAADRYSGQPAVAAEALYRAGMAYQKQAKLAGYDQSASGKAMATLTDFMTLFPDDPRVPQAKKTMESLKGEQAHGSYNIAKFYEKRKKWSGALVYYNEVLLQDPNSPFATQARQRIDDIKKRFQVAAQ